MDSPARGFQPVRHVIEGARAYASARGLADPHDDSIDYGKVQTHRGLLTDLAHHYDALPEHDPAARSHFEAMGNEVDAQYEHLTNRMGIRVQVTDHDPYKDVHELAHDVTANKRIQVLGTHATGGHPFFSDTQNDRFRAVHDVFGHLGAGRDFDRHGEEATYQAHARMFTPHAVGALASETRGQNASLIVNNHFGPQRVAVLPQHLWQPGLARMAARDWSEFDRIQDSQLRDYERAGIGGSSEDRDRYYGLGEMRGGGQQTLLTPKDWITHSRSERLDDQPPQFQAEWAGHELGMAHARTGRVDPEEMNMAADKSSHPEHFTQGYHDGLASGFGERVAVLIETPEEKRQRTAARKPWVPMLVKLAHVSGNNVDLLHCPFCGSGAIFARSDGSVSCQFCDSAFTVQVQPMYAAFPGTVNGQPYMWPGRPQGDNMPGAVGPDAMDPMAMAGGTPGAEDAGDAAQGFAEGQAPMPGQQGPMDDAEAPPGAEGDDPAGDEDPDSGNPFASKGDDDDDAGKAKVKGKSAPPFTKKKSFRTATGALVDEQDYLRHLAIVTARDQPAMTARVKASRVQAARWHRGGVRPVDTGTARRKYRMECMDCEEKGPVRPTQRKAMEDSYAHTEQSKQEQRG